MKGGITSALARRYAAMTKHVATKIAALINERNQLDFWDSIETGCKPVKIKARPAGLEPATPSVEVRFRQK